RPTWPCSSRPSSGSWRSRGPSPTPTPAPTSSSRPAPDWEGTTTMRIAEHDITLPTMMVGNYPKPRWFAGQAWSEVPRGRYMADSVSFEAFSDAILAIVHDQEAAGLDIITDGLMLGG